MQRVSETLQIRWIRATAVARLMRVGQVQVNNETLG